MTDPRALWVRVRDALAADIAGGRYRPGDRLPAEGELSRRFGVNRDTLRRALADLAEAGQLHMRRGARTTVTARPIPCRPGARPRFGANLRGAGLEPGVTWLRLETLPATAEEAEALAIPPGAPVHVVDAVGFADGLPVVHALSRFPAARLPRLLLDLPGTRSVTEALRRAGIPDCERLFTRISAGRARGATARHLACAEGACLLHAVSVNVDDAGTPLEYGRSWFAADRVHLVVDRDAPGLAAPPPENPAPRNASRKPRWSTPAQPSPAPPPVPSPRSARARG